MTSINILPASFQRSYLDKDIFPCNLLQKSISTYPIALAAFSRRLHDAADDLCESNIGKVEVCIRDLKANDGAGRDVAKRNVHKPDDLTTWLGIRRLDQVDDTQCSRDKCHLLGVAEKDPKCRLIYIYGDNTRARLNITRSMLSEILTFHQVMPGFLDFLLTFGLQSDQRGISFSSFREQYALKRSYTKFGISSLGRSGRQYQICYNLKGVTKKSADKEDSINSEFSIRPAVFYHSFDVVGGNSVWIIAKGGTDIYQRFKELTGQDARPEDRSFGSPKECFRSSLSTHLMLCHWSTEDWKGYLKWLEYVVDEQTKRAVLAPTNDGYHYTVYTAADIQRFLSWQERISEVITVLESNVEVMKSLMRFYAKLQSNNDFDLQAVCKDDIEEFNNQLNSVMDDFRMQITRAKALVKLTSDRGELVKQHRLERLNRNMEREAIMVRIVTIVTLIYLPATFVSTFFSTDIIKYQGQNSPQGNFSPIAMERWLQVTLPLTSLTLLIAFYGNKWAENKAGNKMLLTTRSRSAVTGGEEHSLGAGEGWGLGPADPPAARNSVLATVLAWRPRLRRHRSASAVTTKHIPASGSQIV